MLVQNRCKYFECCFWSTFLIPDNRILTPISIGINNHKKFIDFRYLSIDYYRHLISFNDNRLSKLSTSCFRANNFCLAQMTQELSKKYNEVGPPEQLPSGALSQFDNGQNKHWRLLVPTNNAKGILKICVWLSGRLSPPHVSKRSAASVVWINSVI